MSMCEAFDKDEKIFSGLPIARREDISHEERDKFLVSGVKVMDLNPYPRLGLNRFRLESNFTGIMLKNLLFYVTVVGPDISVGKLFNWRNGSYDVTYCVDHLGFYKINIVVQGLNDGAIGLNRRLFTSPFSVMVRKNSKELDPLRYFSNRVCSSALEASSGRWVHSRNYPSLSAYYQVYLEYTRDPYVWLPHSGCRLPVYTREQWHARLQHKRFCWLGDSYARTLLSGLLRWSHMFNDTELFMTEYPQKEIFPDESWSLHNFTMAMRFKEPSIAFFRSCISDPLPVHSILVSDLTNFPEHVLRLASEQWRDRGEKGRFPIIYMTGHAWSADMIFSKRSNVDLEHWSARARTYVSKRKHQEIDLFDAFALSYPRLEESTDGSHFITASNHQVLFLIWESAILLCSRSFVSMS